MKLVDHKNVRWSTQSEGASVVETTGKGVGGGYGWKEETVRVRKREKMMGD